MTIHPARPAHPAHPAPVRPHGGTRALALALLLALAAGAAAAPARAEDDLARFDFERPVDSRLRFEGVAGEHVLAPPLLSPDERVFAAVPGPGSPPPSLAGGFLLDSLEAARGADTYFSVSLAPEDGWALNLSSLRFDMAVDYHPNSLPGDVAVAAAFLYSDRDGYSSLVAAASVLDPTQDGTPSAFTSRSLGLSGDAFQNLTGPVDLRVYVVTTQRSHFVYFDNVVVRGAAVPAAAAAVPEPSSAALWLSALTPLGPAGIAVRQRRRRRERARV